MPQLLEREVQNGLISSMTMMEGFRVQKLLPETVMPLLIIPPIKNRRIYQLVSENSEKTNGRETYTGAAKSQTNRRKTYADVAKSYTNRQKTSAGVAKM